MARPSRITEKVTVIDPLKPEEGERKLSITEAICEMLDKGAFIVNACAVIGLSPATFAHWINRGSVYLDPETGGRADEIPTGELPYVEFVEATTRARARGIYWHEANLRRHAEQDPRSSQFFLERRAPSEYGRRIKIEEEKERRPAPIDRPLAEEAKEAFESAHVPITDPDFLLPEAEPEEVEA